MLKDLNFSNKIGSIAACPEEQNADHLCPNENETYVYFNECKAKKCPKPRWLSPTIECTNISEYGCACKEGYYRLDEDTCLLPDDCPVITVPLPR